MCLITVKPRTVLLICNRYSRKPLRVLGGPMLTHIWPWEHVEETISMDSHSISVYVPDMMLADNQPCLYNIGASVLYAVNPVGYRPDWVLRYIPLLTKFHEDYVEGLTKYYIMDLVSLYGQDTDWKTVRHAIESSLRESLTARMSTHAIQIHDVKLYISPRSSLCIAAEEAKRQRLEDLREAEKLEMRLGVLRGNEKEAQLLAILEWARNNNSIQLTDLDLSTLIGKRNA